jgi:hypothetical protein
MSIFAVNHLCREVLRDHAFRAAMKADPAKALAPLDLTEEERRALVAGDVGALYRMGVNGFLMGIPPVTKSADSYRDYVSAAGGEGR